VSIKDLFNVKGYDSTLGFVAWANSPHDEESELVKLLRDLGAVLYCKTNIPTAMMMPETNNNLFGTTVCPLPGSQIND
jgi:amidase